MTVNLKFPGQHCWGNPQDKDPCCSFPAKEGGQAWNNPFFYFANTFLPHPPSAHKNLPFCTTSLSVSRQTCLDLVHFHFADTAFFLQTEGLWQPCVEQVCRCNFSNSISSLLVSVSHFGNSQIISNFFIITVFVMVISDLYCYFCKRIAIHWMLRWWLAFFSNKVFFN